VGDSWVYQIRSEEVVTSTTSTHYWMNGTMWENVTGKKTITFDGASYDIYVFETDDASATHELSSSSNYTSNVLTQTSSWMIVSNLSTIRQNSFMNETYNVSDQSHWERSHSTTLYVPFDDFYQFPLSVGKNWTVSILMNTVDFYQTDTNPTGSWSNSSTSSSAAYQCTNSTSVTVPAGLYSALVIASGNGNGYNSSTYYSGNVGNTVRFFSLSVGASYWEDYYYVLMTSNYVPPVVYSAPSQPLDLQASPNGNAIDVTWQPPLKNGNATITNYKIYRSESSGSEAFLSEIGTNVSYADASVLKGTKYYYEVTALNSVGESPRSSECNATVPLAPVAPSAPQLLRAVAGDQQVALAWETPSSQGTSTITGYDVYRGSATGGESLLAKIGNALRYNDTGLVNGNTYFYETSAVSAAGEGPKSNEASATPSSVSVPPGTPVGLTPVAGNAQVSLTWSQSASGGTPTSYGVYRSTAQTGPFAQIASTSTADFTDLGLTNGQAYWYEVNAHNQYGTSSNTTLVSATPTAVGNPPGVPVAVSANAGNAVVALTWSEPTSGGTPTSYDVYRSTSASGPYVIVSSPLSTAFTDTGLTNGQTYWYEVDAHNSYGYSQNASAVSATPTAPAPAVYSISGHVYQSGTVTAIPGATVTIDTSPFRTVTSDSSGWYSFTGLTNGSYELTVSASNYLNYSAKAVVSGQNVAIDLTLTPSGEPSTGSSTSMGSSLILIIVVVAVAAVIVAAVAVALLVRRRKKATQLPYQQRSGPYY
jgi:fibronectin type 3 domain-containing protein